MPHNILSCISALGIQPGFSPFIRSTSEDRTVYVYSLRIVTLPCPVLHPGATGARTRAKLTPCPPVSILLQDVWCQPDAVTFKAMLKEKIRGQNDQMIKLYPEKLWYNRFHFRHKFCIFCARRKQRDSLTDHGNDPKLRFYELAHTIAEFQPTKFIKLLSALPAFITGLQR